MTTNSYGSSGYEGDQSSGVAVLERPTDLQRSPVTQQLRPSVTSSDVEDLMSKVDVDPNTYRQHDAE